MTRNDFKETITLPEGVTASIANNIVTCKGPKGEVSREVLARGITVSTSEKEIVLEATNASKTQKNLLFTYKAHFKNLVQGVAEGFTYKLKICSGHFPMNVSLKGNKFEVKNFIGEKVPRELIIKDGADVKIDGDIITVDGVNKETVGQVAADIEQLCRRPGFDKRIFQDGIYITEKAGKQM